MFYYLIVLVNSDNLRFAAVHFLGMAISEIDYSYHIARAKEPGGGT